MRDTQLDIYRAILMIYIPCIVHVMYWLGDGREPFMSLLLIEMPIVFFLSGAAFSVSRSERGLWDTLINRVKRVVLPYYIYALLLVGFGLIVSLLCLQTGWLESGLLGVTRYSWKDIAVILLCQDIPHFPFIWHLWFIPPYLILSCTFPLQVKLMEELNKWAYLAICLSLFIIAQCFTRVLLLRQVLCYNVFMVSGCLFYKKVNAAWIATGGSVTLIAVLLGVFCFGVDFCPMQDHKFPPDWLFVTYNLFALCLVSFMLSRFRFKNNRIFKIWSERGYNIYLYQSVSFAVVHLLRQKTYGSIPWPLVKALMDAAIVFVLSTGLSFLTYPVEKYVMKKLRL